MALVFLKIDDILNTYNIIKSKILSSLNVKDHTFFKYFEKHYIGGIGRKSTFDVKNWSVFERIKNKIPYTTNSAEAWHKSLNFNVGEKGPNLAKMLDYIKTNDFLVEEDLKVHLSKFVNGNSLEYSEKFLELEKIYDIC
jgi:hypothetical protein